MTFACISFAVAPINDFERWVARLGWISGIFPSKNELNLAFCSHAFHRVDLQDY